MADITEQLREDILSGTFPPGKRLVEAELTERYVIGRAAVRAAIVELRTEGLVVHEANRGASVRRIPVEVAIEITQARAVLEGLLARQATERATDADRAELRTVIDDMTSAVDNDDSEAYSELNRILHRRIREISGHSIASELVANLRHRGTHQEFRLSLQPGRSNISLPQHRAIVQAIIDGDGDVAEHAMHAHLKSVEDALTNWIS